LEQVTDAARRAGQIPDVDSRIAAALMCTGTGTDTDAASA
jgi:hypothetical protein